MPETCDALISKVMIRCVTSSPRAYSSVCGKTSTSSQGNNMLPLFVCLSAHRATAAMDGKKLSAASNGQSNGLAKAHS